MLRLPFSFGVGAALTSRRLGTFDREYFAALFALKVFESRGEHQLAYQYRAALWAFSRVAVPVLGHVLASSTVAQLGPVTFSVMHSKGTKV